VYALVLIKLVWADEDLFTTVHGIKAKDTTGTTGQLLDSLVTSVEQSTKNIINIIDNATRETTGGQFMSVDGSRLPW
jgi:hypothetical protein